MGASALPLVLVLAGGFTACPSPAARRLPEDRLVIALAPLTGPSADGETDLEASQQRLEEIVEGAGLGGAPIEIRRFDQAIEDSEALPAQAAAEQIMKTSPPAHLLLWGDVDETFGEQAFRLRLTAGAPPETAQPGTSAEPARRLLEEEATFALDPLSEEELQHLPRFLEGLAYVQAAQWTPAMDVYRGLAGPTLRGALAPLLFDARQLAEWSPDELTYAVSVTGAAAGMLEEDARTPASQAIRSAQAQALFALGERLQGQACVEPLHNAGLIFGRVLEQVSARTHPKLWGDNFMGLGNAMLRLGQRGEGETSIGYLQVAMAAYRQALAVRTRQSHPDVWAEAQFRLGLASLALAQRTSGLDAIASLRQAESIFQNVIEIETRESAPQTWAAVQANLGEIHYLLGNRSPASEAQQHYFNAALAYSQALEVYTIESSPQAWARTNEYLGIAYASLGEMMRGGESVDHLNASISALTRVLDVVNEANDPALWAATQNNLARVYMALPSRVGPDEGAEYLRKALEAYERALRVFSRTSQPRAWAMVQHNYAFALLRLADATSDGSELAMLDRAAAALGAALEFRTPEVQPEDWAASQRILGDILTTRGRLSEKGEAELHLRGAVQAYRLARDPIRAKGSSPSYARLLLGLGTAQAYLAEVAADPAEARSLLDQSLWTLTSAMGSIAHQGWRQLEASIAEQMEAVQAQRRNANATNAA